MLGVPPRRVAILSGATTLSRMSSRAAPPTQSHPPATLQEVLYLLVVDNKVPPEALEHAKVEDIPGLDLTRGPEDTTPLQRLRRWRGPSPMLFPRTHGHSKGIPSPWVDWILRQPMAIPDEALRLGLRLGSYARDYLGLPEDRALQVLAHITLAEVQDVELTHSETLQVFQDFRHEALLCQPGTARSRAGRKLVPPPGEPSKGRGAQKKVLGSGDRDFGLLCHLPAFSSWLSLRDPTASGVIPALYTLLRALPDPGVVPTSREVARAYRLRRGKIRVRTLQAGWYAFSKYAAAFQVALPALPLPPFPRWEVPTPVARALRALIPGEALRSYQQVPLLRRETFLAGQMPVAWDEEGEPVELRALTSQEQGWVSTLLAWNPAGSADDPLVPKSPGSHRKERPWRVWNRLRFELPADPPKASPSTPVL